jgi:hypothetical protein
MSLHLRIEGADALMKKLGRVEGKKLLRPVMTAAVRTLKSAVAQYPPASEANAKGRFNIKTGKPMGYYERGRGWWYPVMRRGTLGESPRKSEGAMRVAKGWGFAGYKLAKGGTSETLGRKWTTKSEMGGLRRVIGNAASYGPVVQDRNKQAAIHARRGWKTIQQVATEQWPRLIEMINAEIRKALAG